MAIPRVTTDADDTDIVLWVVNPNSWVAHVSWECPSLSGIPRDKLREVRVQPMDQADGRPFRHCRFCLSKNSDMENFVGKSVAYRETAA